MGLSLNLQLPTADLMQKQANQQYLALLNKTNFANFMGSQLTGLISDGIGDAFGNSGIGRQIGNVFGNGLGSVGGTMLSNYLKGNTLMQGVSKNLGASLQGAASGLVADFAGKGVNALMGDSKLGNFAGGATSSALGLILGGGIGNPITFGANVLGSGLSSMLGPSKEYGGKYGNITLTMDSIYGGIQGVAGLFGPVGQAVSAGMALNKGLSNLFGSTDGMTKQDAILGSAFMPAPVKWLNAGLGKKTGSFDNQSWQNQEKANSFMLNGFGDLGERFDLARYEANKKYGLFSQHARRKAQRNIDFANIAWDLVLAMADLNELQNIRSLYMSSINNLRYAQMLGGGLKPLLIGKQGMKILNNQTNHNMGLRLLSAAALIDNKAMILSALGGTKLTRLRPKPLPKKPATREENPELWDEWERREAEQQATRLQVYDLERQAAAQRAETNARHALHYSNLATGVAETAQQNTQFEPVTQESLQNSNIEKIRQELLDDKNEYFDNGMKFINAAGMADLGVNVTGPLLQKGFRWAFNKAGLLVRVPLESRAMKITPENTASINKNIGTYSYKYKDPNNETVDFFKQFLALLKIMGKELNFDGNLTTSKNVQIGLPENIKSYHNLNTVKRAVKAMRDAGYSEREILLYIDKVNEEMNKVKVGTYSKEEYDAAGSNFGGFFNDEENFISVNKDAYKENPKFTTDYILKHEGRHLIDFRTSMTDEIENILSKAYDDDFLNIPNLENAGELKGYQYMKRERVTTNRDARDSFFQNKNIDWIQDENKYLEHTKPRKPSTVEEIFNPPKREYPEDMVEFLNLILKYAQPEDIVKAVETSNGYGRRFIEYLRKNNKLTSEKIEQLREAMIRVPGYVLPIATAATLYNSHKKGGKILKAQNGTYFKPNGKYSLISSEHSLPEVLVKGKNKINAETFLGKITKLLGGSPTTIRFVDEGSSTALLIRPYGYILGGLDLGSDIYDAIKGDENKDWTDVALDAASLLPWVNKLGLKNNPKGLFKWIYNNRKTINNISNTAKGVDYVNDSHILGEFKESNPLLIVTK